MSELEQQKLSNQLDQGLTLAYENMLRRKALLGQDIIAGDEEGNPIRIPAKVQLDRYLAENGK